MKDKDAHKSNLRRLKHDPNFKKRVGFLLELIITLPIGTITAFIFERKVTFALIALGVFVFLFIHSGISGSRFPTSLKCLNVLNALQSHVYLFPRVREVRNENGESHEYVSF